MKTMQKISIVVLLVVGGLFAAQAQAVGMTVAQVENAYGGGAVFLDIQDGLYTSGTDASMSLMLNTGNIVGSSGWSYPDGSDDKYAVGEIADGVAPGQHLDDKGNTAPDFMVTIAFGAAAAGQDFDLDITMVAKDHDADLTKSNDFSWGLGTDGAAINVVLDAWAVRSKEIFTTGTGTYAIGVNLGTFTADANGDIALWLGTATITDGNLDRTEFDGIVVVPEPATMLLFGLGSVVTLVRRKK